MAGLVVAGCTETPEAGEPGGPVLRINIATDDVLEDPVVGAFIADGVSPSMADQVHAACVGLVLWKADDTLNTTILIGDFRELEVLAGLVEAGDLDQGTAQEIGQRLISGVSVADATAIVADPAQQEQVSGALTSPSDSPEFVTFASAITLFRAEIIVARPTTPDMRFPNIDANVTAVGASGVTERQVWGDECRSDRTGI